MTSLCYSNENCIQDTNVKSLKVAIILTHLGIGGAQEIVEKIFRTDRLHSYRPWLLHGEDVPLFEQVHPKLIRIENKIVVKYLKRRISPYYDFLALFELIIKLRKSDYDVVHTHNSKAGLLGVLAARFVGIPKIIYHEHNPAFNTSEKKWEKYLFRIMARIAYFFSTSVVTVAPHIKQQLINENLVSGNKVSLVLPGIDFSDYKTSTLSTHTDLKIGFVGRLTKSKGIHDFMTVAETLIARNESVQIFVIGGGEEFETLQSWKEKLSPINQHIQLLGSLNHETLTKWYSQLDLIVFPSISEGLSLVLIESLSRGVEVIAYDIPGNRDLLNFYPSLHLVRPYDVLLLEKETLQGIKRLRVEARQGRGEFPIIFSYHRMTKELAEIYFQ